MAGGGVTEGRGVERPRIGEPVLAGRGPDSRGEILEAGRRGDLQTAQWFLGADDEGVRQADRQQDEVSWTGCEFLPVAQEAWIADQMHHGLGLDTTAAASGGTARVRDDS